MADLLNREFFVDSAHSTDKVRELGVTEFGYSSLHLVTLSEPRSSLGEWSRFSGFPVEIQIRTVLQHAWASISHKLDYKAASEAPNQLRRQLFRLSALLELADEDFASLRDRSQNIAAQYKDEVDRGELNLPLDLDSLTQFLKERIDLRYWAELGLEAGMVWDEAEYNLLRSDLEVSPFLSTLQAVGVSKIAEVQSLLDELKSRKTTALEWLSEYVQLHKSTLDKDPNAVGADNLMLLVSFLCAEKLPESFNWDGVWNDSLEAALKGMVKDIANRG